MAKNTSPNVAIPRAPGSLSKNKLKELPTRAAVEAFVARPSGNDYEVVMRGCAIAEIALKQTISLRMRQIHKDDRKRTFDGASGGIFGTFSNKIEICYLFALIDYNEYHDLMLIKSIRNLFAHSSEQIGFGTQAVMDDCLKLKYANAQRAKRRFCQSIQMVFTVAEADLLFKKVAYYSSHAPSLDKRS